MLDLVHTCARRIGIRGPESVHVNSIVKQVQYGIHGAQRVAGLVHPSIHHAVQH